MKQVRYKALTPSSQGDTVQLFLHRNTSSVSTPMFSFCVVFQAALFFRSTMMSDKKTVQELKKASMKPFLLLREKRQQKGQSRKQREGIEGQEKPDKYSLTSTL